MQAYASTTHHAALTVNLTLTVHMDKVASSTTLQTPFMADHTVITQAATPVFEAQTARPQTHLVDFSEREFSAFSFSRERESPRVSRSPSQLIGMECMQIVDT